MLVYSQFGDPLHIFILVCLGGVALTCVRSVYLDVPSAYTLTQRTYGNQMIYLITRIGWPPAVWLQFLHASLVPPLYALFPPRVPPRDEILIADPKTSIKYPRPEVMRLKRSAWGLWRYLRATVVIIYTIFLFVISFFIFDPAIPSPQKTAPK